jgi:anaerobic magnesium-protoporphyrin IX monomethyl ester cyclase
MCQHVTFINTPCYEIMDDRLEPPLGLLYLATLLNHHGYRATITDLASAPPERWRQLIPPADVYGFYTYTPTYHRTLQLLPLIRRLCPSAVLVAGGPHASALPQQVARDFDFVVVGEGEQALLALLSALQKGERPQPIQHEIPLKDLDSLPFPDYNLVDRTSYRRLVANHPSAAIISTRGCAYRCAFCTSTITGVSRQFRYRSPQNLVAEIAQLRERYHIKSFKIQDDVFTLGLGRIREISRLLAPLDVVYRCNARVDLCTDSEMLSQLYAGGCRHITFGVETASPRLLARMGKRQTTTQVRRAIALAKEAGLIVRANLVVGFPGETWDTVQETIDLMLACKPQEYVISAFVPFPGTEAYTYPERYGIAELEEDFSQYFMLRRNQESSYIFRTSELTPQVVADMRASMIRALAAHIGWVGSSTGYTS